MPANGFYEWRPAAAGGHRKQPFYIYPAIEGELFGLAGLWERWTGAGGEPLDTFTIVTTAANAVMRPLHDRMPVLLAPADYGAWLDDATAPDQARALVRPCADALLATRPVSTAVGNVRNDGPELIASV